MNTDFLPKSRTTPDCMTNDPAAWNAAPSAVEQAYRRGRVQGFLEAVRLAREGEALDEIERFGYGRLWRWRYAAKMKYELPPQFQPERRAKA